MTVEEMEAQILEEMREYPEVYANEPELVTPINDILIVDPETRLIYVPESEENFGTYNDNDVARKYFICPRIVQDNIDLSSCNIFINYISAKGKPGQWQCEDVKATEDGNYVTFTWPLKRNVFDANKDSTIYFAVQAKKVDGGNVFNTRKAQGKSYETIDATEQITEEYADVILQLIARIENLEKNPVPEETIEQAIETYFAGNPLTAEDVGADPAGTAVAKVTEHNVAVDAHEDIRLELKQLANRFNALADSDDETLDQMSEVVAYIKSNKTLIEAITIGKVSVGDIINNLTTNVANKPLSAAQGVVLKGLIDAITIPEELPNPHPLTINVGDTEIVYDGKEVKSITIPDGAQIERVEIEGSVANITLQPNKLTVFIAPEMDKIMYQFAEGESDVANEYHFIFQSGATPTEVIHAPGVNIGNFTVEANKIYEISILENCLTSQSWDVTI